MPKGVVWIFGVLWLISIGVGLGIMLSYENAPGVALPPPPTWPGTSTIQPVASLPTLLMSVHPHCPCTRASLGELAVLLARCKGRVSTYVLFYAPTALEKDWAKTDLWKSAEMIPGVTPVVDPDGFEAHKFHLTISGQSALYDRNGKRIFYGGITPSRGHSGDNVGRSTIESLLIRGRAATEMTAAFGCELTQGVLQCQIKEHPHE